MSIIGNKQMRKGTVILLAVLAHSFFGFSFIFSKMALEVTDAFVILPVRFLIAFAVLSLLIVLKVVPFQFKGKKKRGKLFLMSLMQPLIYFIFELYGLQRTSSSFSGMMISLIPVGVLILSVIFLKEKPTLLQICCMILSVLCAGLISYFSQSTGTTDIWGIIFLLIAVLSAAGFNLFSKEVSETYSPFERTWFMFLVGSISFLIFSVVGLRENFFTAWGSALSNGKFWVAILYLSLGSSIGAFLLYNISVNRMKLFVASSFANISTVISVLAGRFLLHEDFTDVQLLLCIPVLLGVWGVNLRTLPFGKKKKQEETNSQ